MFPEVGVRKGDIVLHEDDITGIQSLYGPPNGKTIVDENDNTLQPSKPSNFTPTMLFSVQPKPSRSSKDKHSNNKISRLKKCQKFVGKRKKKCRKNKFLQKRKLKALRTRILQ
ncbi:hypothetical protein EB796_002973 [Bugula neritina]|uniref:Uncharacterized protein n=1 Tax=Bugula neritina TaxID=10212 RepID=A0A7J7KKC6_BUGNE|nr:hypothetical protein EB796_002973 [Bugula neritina]